MILLLTRRVSSSLDTPAGKTVWRDKKKCSCTWRWASIDHWRKTRCSDLIVGRMIFRCSGRSVFRTDSPLINTRWKGRCWLVTRSSDNVRRKPSVPTWTGFPFLATCIGSKGGSIATPDSSAIVSRVARRTFSKVRTKATFLLLIRSARIISPAAIRPATILRRQWNCFS